MSLRIKKKYTNICKNLKISRKNIFKQLNNNKITKNKFFFSNKKKLKVSIS